MKKALEKMIEGTREERIFLSEQSFLLFSLYYFKQYFSYPLAPFHYDFIEDLKDLMSLKIRECVWLGFRECGKTSYAKLFLIWLIIFKKKEYINVDSFDKENAERILFDIAFELTNNKYLQADFGVLFSRERSITDIKQNRINNFVTENGIRVEAHSTQESIRGRLHLNKRPDFLLLDDFENNKTKASKAYTEQVQGHITEAMAGMGAEGVILYLANYITEFGNVQNLINRSKTDDKIRIRNIPILNEKGEPTWKSKYVISDEEAKNTGKISIEAKKKQLGSYVFSYEMMNMPVDDTLSEFKKEYINTRTHQEILALLTRVFITIDPAISSKDSADYTGITINYVDRENKWNIITIEKRLNVKELVDTIFGLYTIYTPESIGIEESSFVQAIKPFLDDEMRKRQVFLPIKLLKTKGINKEARIRALIPRWESRSIICIQGQCEPLLDQMRSFPNSQYDDVLDSCFVAGTKIIVRGGYKNIENIKIGDEVLTRQGFKKVINCGCTGIKPTIQNIGLEGTWNHPIFTEKGLKNLEDITNNDLLYIWKQSRQQIERQFYTRDINSTDTLNLKERTLKTIFGHIFPKSLLEFIDKYGLIILEKFQEGITYITKIIIHSIIRSTIFVVLVGVNILNTIWEKKKGENKLEIELRRISMFSKLKLNDGEIQREVKTGIVSTLKTVLTKLKKLFVKNVEIKQLGMHNVRDFVVESVVEDFRQENLSRETQTIIEKKVYNLEVEDCPEYFANNILVHNCAYQLDIAKPPMGGEAYIEDDFFHLDQKTKINPAR